MKSKTKIIVSFCLSILLLVLVGGYAYYKTSQYKSAVEWVSHTRQVISETQKMLLDIQGVETAQRGYIITGKEEYLDPYHNGAADIDSTYGRIKGMITDNSAQLFLLDTIYAAMNTKVAFSKNAVALRKSGNSDAAKKLVTTGEGERLMKKIRADVAVFIAAEEKLLTERLDIAWYNFNTTVTVLIVSISLALLTLLITLYFFIREHQNQVTAKKKLAESEQRIKSFLESLPMAVYVMEGNGQPFYANSKSAEILGDGIRPDKKINELSELYGVYVAGTDKLYPTDQLPIVKALRGELTVNSEDMEIRREGYRVPIRVNTITINDADGNIEYAIAVFEDITDKKEADRKLVEAKKLAEASGLLKETFLANMSHEIRTPMNAIIGFTDLLLRKNLSEQETDYVNTIKTAGESLLRIINDVLDISKMESGMMAFESDPISLKAIFSSLEAMISQRARQKNLRLSFGWENDLPDTMLGDPTRLTQIILNLVGNAIKFTDKGGVEVYAKVAREETDFYEIEFTIKDTGIGIPENKLTQIFERFTQAESYTTRHYGGTGLGLSIAKQLVELQGGKISVSSTPGVGSVFSFTLPFKKTNEMMDRGRKKIPLPDIEVLRTKSILVVEDNPINIKLIQYLFEIYNLWHDLALNGAEAVNKVRSKPYDIILMDIEMPEMNGYQATAVIRNELKNNVPIIAMTAHAMAGEKEKCLQSGMNGYVAKPIRENLLFETMVRLTTTEQPEKPEDVYTLINLDYLVTTMHHDKRAIRETMDIFLELLPPDIAALNDAVHTADYPAIRQFAHRMKPTAATMGAMAMEKALALLEALAIQQASTTSMYGLLDSINRMSRQAQQEVMAEREKYMG